MELPRVDIEQLRALMKLMEQFDFQELDLREDGKRLHLLRGGKQAPAAPQVVMPTMLQSPLPAAPASRPSETGPAAAEAVEAGVKVVTSPMVGTFYRAPGPDASPFVEEGAKVGEDTVLCIIEAMKVMNEIKAEIAGEVAKILVANGEAVEYGEPLFHIRTK